MPTLNLQSSLHTGRSLLKVCSAQSTEKDAQQQKQQSTSDSSARQLLGMKGASEETNIWKIRVQLTKPVTWVPLIWGGCIWTGSCA